MKSVTFGCVPYVGVARQLYLHPGNQEATCCSSIFSLAVYQWHVRLKYGKDLVSAGADSVPQYEEVFTNSYGGRANNTIIGRSSAGASSAVFRGDLSVMNSQRLLCEGSKRG